VSASAVKKLDDCVTFKFLNYTLYYTEGSISISYKFRYMKIRYIYEEVSLRFISYMAWYMR